LNIEKDNLENQLKEEKCKHHEDYILLE